MFLGGSVQHSSKSALLLLRMHPSQVGMFRFLLEAHGHTGFFTVLEKQTALVKFGYAQEMEQQVAKVLKEIATTVPFTCEPWPMDGATRLVGSIEKVRQTDE